MPTIKIDPDAVDGTAKALHQGASQVQTGGSRARRALWHTDDLPPAFRHKAQALGGQMSSTGYYACDALAVAGLELSRRAEIARIVDAQPFAGGSQNPQTPVGARQDLGLWNEATRAAAHAKPGSYFAAIDGALGALAASGVAAAAVVTPGAPAAPRVGSKQQRAKHDEPELNLPDERTGSLVTLDQAIAAADTSGTGVAIAVGREGRLSIASTKPR